MTVREIAEDIDFAIDVTEPRDVRLARFEAIIAKALTATRAEAREAVAEMMLQSSLATGHGDTLGDLLTTLAQQIEELWRARR